MKREKTVHVYDFEIIDGEFLTEIVERVQDTLTKYPKAYIEVKWDEGGKTFCIMVPRLETDEEEKLREEAESSAKAQDQRALELLISKYPSETKKAYLNVVKRETI